jgi:gamma-glutamyltranspeptidase/glutathione hydrolase
MRDFHFPGRSCVHALNAMAATSQPGATLVAIEILRRGGNAIDAAVAASAALCVIEPASTGIGGDCFALYVPGGAGEVIALNGSGRAPAAAEAEWFLERGIRELVPGSPHCVTIPGAIDAWARPLEDHGTMGLEEVLAPAIAYAEEGFAVHPRTAWDWARLEPKLRDDENAERILLPRGRAPRVGEVIRFPELASTLRAIAAKGRDGFYTGEVAEDMVAYLQGLGGLHTLDDFVAHASDYVTPIQTDYRGFQVFECPPNGQGIAALMMLNILGGFELQGLDPVGIERLHLEAEATRLAFEARDSLIADPAKVPVPVDELLSAAHANELRDRIRPDRAMGAAARPSPMPAHADTIYLTVVDGDCNAVSFINSTFHGFGSGLVSPKTGVNFQNRGSGFRVDPDHPNCVAPGKRPLHTIIPGMLMRDGRAEMPFGVMGGGFQPVGHTHLLTNMLDFGMDPQEALDCPRAFHHEGKLQLERGVSDRVADGLTDLGHDVVRADMPLGGGQAIRIDWESGVLSAGSDPRKDGCAIGY